MKKDEKITLWSEYTGNRWGKAEGRDYVIQAKFDPIREAILTGKEIDHVVILSRER